MFQDYVPPSNENVEPVPIQCNKNDERQPLLQPIPANSFFNEPPLVESAPESVDPPCAQVSILIEPENNENDDAPPPGCWSGLLKSIPRIFRQCFNKSS